MEKEFTILVNNAMYDTDCGNSEETHSELVDKAHSLDARILTENLLGIEMLKVQKLLTKPSYV